MEICLLPYTQVADNVYVKRYTLKILPHAEIDDGFRVRYPTNIKSAYFDLSLKHPAGLATLKGCDTKIQFVRG